MISEKSPMSGTCLLSRSDSPMRGNLSVGYRIPLGGICLLAIVVLCVIPFA